MSADQIFPYIVAVLALIPYIVAVLALMWVAYPVWVYWLRPLSPIEAKVLL